VVQGTTGSKGIFTVIWNQLSGNISPVVKFQTLRLLLVLAVSKDFEIHQVDIETIFLGQDLSGDEQSIYMELSPGISRGP